MLEQLKSYMTWPVVRALLIATVTLFIGSALLTPHLNPATRGSVRTAESIGPVWGELVQWRVALVQASQELGHWPKDIQKYAPQVPFPKLRVSSPGPLRLQADDLGRARPYLQDDDLRRLFWGNLIHVRGTGDAARLHWRCDTVRHAGLMVLEAACSSS